MSLPKPAAARLTIPTLHDNMAWRGTPVAWRISLPRNAAHISVFMPYAAARCFTACCRRAGGASLLTIMQNAQRHRAAHCAARNAAREEKRARAPAARALRKAASQKILFIHNLPLHGGTQASQCACVTVTSLSLCG